ncbi:hypothetical protein [Novosphingobium decolorationis]|uniref:Uncharacterized protein n=1 Tax=Novosphingobium decolorationis TaxID=2698673 RepID=A0ABX8E2M5_9SPHN|nr:hypothetical protein [Novosphingobium decolorationis]QVM83386.1 hypothetical protein HT578_06490 [Novosphingobium decolorationis]
MSAPPPAPSGAPDPAARRFFIIQAVRLLGVACVVVGILIAKGGLFAPAPPALGYVLVANGLVDLFLIPALLARKWRSRPGDQPES